MIFPRNVLLFTSPRWASIFLYVSGVTYAITEYRLPTLFFCGSSMVALHVYFKLNTPSKAYKRKLKNSF